MDELIIYGLGLVLLYCCLAWLFPAILSWYIQRKYHLEAQIGRINILKCTLHDVSIKKNGFSIHIDKIGFRSSFFSSEVTKALCVVIYDVRIKKDLVSKPADQVKVLCLVDISFHNQKIPPFIITFAQFLAIHVRSITAILLRPESPEWLLHASANDVQLDGSLVRSARTLLVNVTMTSATAKLLRHAPTATKPKKPLPTQFATCLAELSVSLSMEVTLLAQGPISIEKLCIALENVKGIINDGFYGFAQQRYQSITGVPKKTPSKQLEIEQIYKLLYDLTPIIPKIALIKVENSTITGMKDATNTEINASLQKFQIKTCFTSHEISYKEFNERSLWPHFAMDVLLNGFDIRGNRDNILALQEFKLDSKVERKFMSIKMLVNTFTLVYNHKDIHSWLTTNFGSMSPTTPEETHEAIATRRTSFLDWINYFALEVTIELYNVTILLNLSNNVMLGFNSVKFLLNCDSIFGEENREFFNANKLYSKLPLSLAKRNWACDYLMDSVWANLNANNDRATIKTPHIKKYHYWGYPFYVGAALVKVRGCLLPKSPKLQVMLDTVRLEWSPPLASFLQQLVDCVNDYQFLKKEYHPSNSALVEARTGNVESSSIFWNLTLSSVNMFFIAERKVCMMLRTDSIQYNCDSSRLSSSFQGVKLASIVPTSNNFACMRSEDLKNTCCSFKSIQFDQKNQNKKLELSEDIDFVWSTNLHLKLLTLYSDIAKTSRYIFLLKTYPQSDDMLEEEPKMSSTIKATVKGRCRVGVKMSNKRQILFLSGTYVCVVTSSI